MSECHGHPGFPYREAYVLWDRCLFILGQCRDKNGHGVMASLEGNDDFHSRTRDVAVGIPM